MCVRVQLKNVFWIQVTFSHNVGFTYDMVLLKDIDPGRESIFLLLFLINIPYHISTIH